MKAEDKVAAGVGVLAVRLLNDPILDIARGLSGADGIHKFGRNPDVGTGGEEDIWSVGGDYPFPQTALALRVKAGGNAADTAAGVGARELTIFGLDENWDQASETLVTAGASASAPTTTTFIRVFRVHVSGCGAYGGGNTGVIDIETTGGTTLARLMTGIGQTQMAIVTIPAGFTAHLRRIEVGVGGTNKTVTVYCFQRDNADVIVAPFGAKRLVTTIDEIAAGTTARRRYDSGFPTFAEKTDIWFRAQAFTNAAAVDVQFDLIGFPT